MEIPGEMAAAIEEYSHLGRWDRAELGRALRRHGLSYGEIMDLIPVPKGTLAYWCRDIQLSDDQIAAIKERCGPAAGPRDTQWRRRLEIEKIEEDARRFALEHLDDSFWVAGTVLYWGEGSKTKRRLQLANSDPRALRLFMRWCEGYLHPSPAWVAALNLHEENDEAAALAYWRRELGLEPNEFTKTYIKSNGTGHRKNHLPCGVCRVTLRRSTDAFVRTMKWIETLAERWS